MIVSQLWKREYSNARYQPFPAEVDPVRFAAFRVLQAIQQRRVMSIPPVLSVRYRAPAAAAFAGPWYLAGGAPTPIAVYQPKGAATLAASYVNLVTPGTYNAAPGTAPTFDTTTGWTFNGSSQYLTTGVVPTSQSWSMLIRFSNASGQGTILAGATGVGAPPWFIIQPNRADNTVGYFSGSYLLVGPAATSGVFAIAGNKGYRNGTAESGTIPASAGAILQIYIGCQNATGVPGSHINAKVQAVAIYNTSTNHATWMPAVMAAVALI